MGKLECDIDPRHKPAQWRAQNRVSGDESFICDRCKRELGTDSNGFTFTRLAADDNFEPWQPE